MNVFALLFLILGLGLIGWLTARARAARMARGLSAKRLHSLPSQHGWYVATWAVVPALIFLIVWVNVSPALVTETVLVNPAAAQLLLLPGENPLHFPASGGIGAGGLEIPPDSQYTTQTIHPTAEACRANKRVVRCAAAAAWWLASRSSLRMQSWRYVSR